MRCVYCGCMDCDCPISEDKFDKIVEVLNNAIKQKRNDIYRQESIYEVNERGECISMSSGKDKRFYD